MRFKLKILFVTFLLCAAFQGFSAAIDPLPFHAIESGKAIESSMEGYIGNDNNPRNFSTAAPSQFRPYEWKTIPEGKSSTWVRLRIDNTGGAEQKLVIGNNQFDFLEFYAPIEEDSFKVKLSGNLCDHNLSEIVFAASSWFSFTLPSNKVSTFLIRCSNNKKIPYQYSKLGFTLYHESDFNTFKNRQTYFNYFFWGAILIITFYNLVLYFQLRSRIYLYYVANNIIILLFVLCQAGSIDELFFSNSRFHEEALMVLGNVAFIFYTIFCKSFLDLKNNRPRLNKILNWILAFWLTPLLLIPFNRSAIAVSIGGVVAIWGYTMIMISAFRLIKKGENSARFFFIANLFYYIGIIVSILQIAKVLPYIFLGMTAVNFVQVGTLLQLSLFSLTVGFRIIKMQKEMTLKQIEQEKFKAEEEHKRRILIEEQNISLEKKVAERTLELASANDILTKQSEILESQKDLLEERQKEIIDSITYARYIQYALLAHTPLLEQHLPPHFILFQPKDIVSGDFYWAVKNGNRFYLAICDCTGHGVPGAFMSLLSVTFLNEAVIEKGIIEPNKILDHVRRRLIGSLSEHGFKDGMDGTLLCFTEGSSEIQYASAYNKPLLIRNGKVQILPADKMPVGQGLNELTFSLHSIAIEKGDALYLYTDGFADQFGGPQGKKFMYRQLMNLLLNTHDKSPTENKQILQDSFNMWKQNEDQVDDICVAGIFF